MKILDCRGLACPLPVIRCRTFLEEERPDACEVLVDNDAGSINVSRFLEQRGFVAQVRQESPTLWRIYATRDGAPTLPADTPSPAAAPAPEAATRTLVFITTPTIGRGDEVLGTKLMGTFLSTLPELGNRLWRIILLNGGVKLAAMPGPALDALRKLNDAGVSILVCGTCLAHYGLAEAKAVGETSNMLDIVTSLDLADKIIRP